MWWCCYYWTGRLGVTADERTDAAKACTGHRIDDVHVTPASDCMGHKYLNEAYYPFPRCYHLDGTCTLSSAGNCPSDGIKALMWCCLMCHIDASEYTINLWHNSSSLCLRVRIESQAGTQCSERFQEGKDILSCWDCFTLESPFLCMLSSECLIHTCCGWK